MVAMPNTPVVEALLQALSGEEVEQPLLFAAAEMPCETSRRRAVGAVQVFLVDAPWSLLNYFRKASFGRASRLELGVILSGTWVASPVASEAGVVADAWVLSAMDDPSQSDAGLGEYVTGVSQEKEAEHRCVPGLQSWKVLAWELDGCVRFDNRCLLQRAHEPASRSPANLASDNMLAEMDAGVLPEDTALPGMGDNLLQRLLLAQTQMLAQLANSQPKSWLEGDLGTEKAKGDRQGVGRARLKDLGEPEQEHVFEAQTWNVAGAPEDHVRHIVGAEVEADLLAIQEWTRAKVGWSFLEACLVLRPD